MHFIVQDENAQMPTRATFGSAGYDFYSPIDAVILPKSEIIIDLGVSQIADPCDVFGMESSYVVLLMIRSSLALKHRLSAINPVAIIDSDYPGTIRFGLRNDGETEYSIRKGDRICQGVILPYFLASNEMAVTKHRDNGIGSTGK